MAFRYINPGYGIAMTFENFTYNPQHGIVFRPSDYTCEHYSNIHSQVSLPEAFSSDVYGKFNFYFDASDTNSILKKVIVGANGRSSGNESGFAIKDSKAYLYIKGSVRGEGISIIPQTLYSVWFHVHAYDPNKANDEAYGELVVNGNEQRIAVSLYLGEMSTEAFTIRYPDVYMDADVIYWCPKEFYISNLIISDEFISKDEKILVLPVSTTATDMTAGASGIYTATEAGQTLLQSIDVAALTSANRAQTKITGIGVAGVPAYYTNALVTTMTALSKSGTVTNEHGTCELGSDSTGAIVTGWGLSNATIADLQNMQFGWKAGT